MLRGPYGGRGRSVALAGLLLLALGGVLGLRGFLRHAGQAPRAGRSAEARLPALPPLPTAFDGITLAQRLRAAPVGPIVEDDLLGSSVLDDADFTRAVHAWVDYWSGPASGWFPGFLERMARLGPLVDTALSAEGFPPSLRYLPLIESGYDPRVRSRARAVGLWQLMSTTADDLGLQVDDVVDERRHVERSTEGALRYLAALHDEFGSWFVALAAYNSGPARVRQVLRREAPGQSPTDSLFWALRAHFPRETREFVPKLYGAMWVASRPEAYGYARPEPEPYVFDLVSVPDATTLHVVALAAGAEYDEVVRLNPEFLQGITPVDRVAAVRIPSGRAGTFLRIYPRIHPAERTTEAPVDEGSNR